LCGHLCRGAIAKLWKHVPMTGIKSDNAINDTNTTTFYQTVCRHGPDFLNKYLRPVSFFTVYKCTYRSEATSGNFHRIKRSCRTTQTFRKNPLLKTLNEEISPNSTLKMCFITELYSLLLFLKLF
jgi:hypothetical protein